MFVDDGDGKIEIVPEAVGVLRDGVDMRCAVRIELRASVELNEVEAESLGGELLSGIVGTVTLSSESVMATDK